MIVAGIGNILAGAFDALVGAIQVFILNPPWSHVLTQQEVASAKGDNVYDYYIDFETYDDVAIQFTRTSGSGTDTVKIFASAVNDGTAQESVDEIDVGTSHFGSATWTASAFITPTKKFRAKYIHIELTRTGDTGTDGAWQFDIMGG